MITDKQRTALIIIDVQQGFNDPAWGAGNNPEAEKNILQLMNKWRKQELPLIHVQHDSLSPSGFFRPGTPGNLAKVGTEPQPGEPIYRKTVNSAFIGTTLESDLRSRRMQGLIIVGFTTNHCVSTTARMAGNLGSGTFVVSDATAAFETRAIDGSLRSAGEVHNPALSDLRGEFAQIVNTSSILASNEDNALIALNSRWL